MDNPHLLIAVSSHGFGHFAQVVPVIRRLGERLPRARITLRTALPRSVVAARLEREVALQRTADDFGMVNNDAFAVDVEASARRYAEFHADWPQRVARASADVASARPDLVLADVPYLTLAAAAHAGIPAVALCSLNWADIYRHYCAGRPEAERIHDQMLTAYNSAERFLIPAPGMPMPLLDNRQAIGPIAERFPRQRAELRRRAGLDPEARLVIVAMGGIATRVPFDRWPRIPGVHWVVQRDWLIRRPDVLVLEELGSSLAEVLASCDALITKPGYGAFAEAAAAGIPVLFVPRDDWPESTHLVDWLERHGRCEAIPREALDQGDVEGPLMRLMEQGTFAPVEPSGIDEAVDWLLRRLSP